MNTYKSLNKQTFSSGEYSIVPIRSEDRYKIMQWRNEQMYHLRQHKLLEKDDQDRYFDLVVSKLFEVDYPEQILFSYLKGDKCIGYGGLVHINWLDRNAEVSFIMDTKLEKANFEFHWRNYLKLLELVAWNELKLHKIFTYAFDIRPQLYSVLEKAYFNLDAVLNEHCYFEGKFLDVVIHSKINKQMELRQTEASDLQITFKWANNPSIRVYSFNKKNITLKDHAGWFFSKLESSECEYYILEVYGKPVGSIRFDIEENDVAKISYLLDPNFTGQGLGTYLLEKGIGFLKENRADLKKVYGIVFSENAASVRIFVKLDFKRVSGNNTELKFEKYL